MYEPLISVITICYNSSKYIRSCIESVNEQTYSNIEHVFIDACSTDSTVQIIQNYSKRNFTLISERDQGIYDAMSKGLNFCKGDIIGFLNSDDFFHSNEVLEDISKVLKDKSIDIVHGHLKFIDYNNKIVRYWRAEPFYKGQFGRSMSPAHPTFYCRRDVYERVGAFSLNYKIVGDLEFMFRALQLHNHPSVVLNKYFVYMRIGGVSTRSFFTTWHIFKEVKEFHKQHNVRFNSFVYWLSKFRKLLNQKVLKA